LAIVQQAELGKGMRASSLGVGREGRKNVPFAFVIITLVLGKQSMGFKACGKPMQVGNFRALSIRPVYF